MLKKILSKVLTLEKDRAYNIVNQSEVGEKENNMKNIMIADIKELKKYLRGLKASDILESESQKLELTFSHKNYTQEFEIEKDFENDEDETGKLVGQYGGVLRNNMGDFEQSCGEVADSFEELKSYIITCCETDMSEDVGLIHGRITTTASGDLTLDKIQSNGMVFVQNTTFGRIEILSLFEGDHIVSQGTIYTKDRAYIEEGNYSETIEELRTFVDDSVEFGKDEFANA